MLISIRNGLKTEISVSKHDFCCSVTRRCLQHRTKTLDHNIDCQIQFYSISCSFPLNPNTNPQVDKKRKKENKLNLFEFKEDQKEGLQLADLGVIVRVYVIGSGQKKFLILSLRHYVIFHFNLRQLYLLVVLYGNKTFVSWF